jgi:hypothetical protein
LQIIKRFGKKGKGFFNFILAVGRNSAGSRARPGQPLLSSPLPRSPAEVKRPSQNRPAPASRAAQPARFLPRGVEKSQNRGHRLPDAAPSHTRPTDPDPNPVGVRPWLPRTPSPHTFPELTYMEIAGRLRTKGNKNQILTDYLSIPSPNPKFSWRLGSGCCCAPARAFAPINRTLRRPPEHFSPLPLPFPN